MYRERELPDALASAVVPGEVRDIAARLEEAGGQAWIVGGAVRDSILGRQVRDWDLATDLLPETIRSLFPRTVAVGAQFGTIVVVGQDDEYEVTTFRRDLGYSDGRHPDTVEYSTRPEDDLARRDFTVNALAWNPDARSLLDPHGGLADLDARRLRTVGTPHERFAEDALRILRAVRLSVQLDFEIERDTLRAVVRLAPTLTRVSRERVAAEMERILGTERAGAGLELLHETGLLSRILPELVSCYGVAQNPHHAYDVFYHTLAAVDGAAPEDRLVRWAALFHDVGKPETRVLGEHTATFYSHQIRSEQHARRALSRLRFSNEDRGDVAHLVRQHMFHYTSDWSDGAVRRFLRTVGPDQVRALYRLRAADTRGNGKRTRVAPELDELAERIEQVLASDAALSVKDLAISGHDLMDRFGRPPGKWIGSILHALLEDVLEDPSRNEPSALLARAEELLGLPQS
ncbi:MAG: CCA tRNA nucleotidyltransferase [Candidatus Eisenbacteria bacterium]|uniref:CCA tRNA nucleotidyltransferase n=1 Tax=Eiseniibacteriota bacterium TaxID=2212470 RepID=A0A956ND80_UNCEI|nr:CCA tRNA nucleotidyltransferase [Candidatus Eisenbacteria bacterium]MCB9462426.1 CCA tRNA nucleotidyltransferase [Candidatus Eisenbacteria bacterium]